MSTLQPDIRDLALIGDRKTCAVVTRNASIVWYCPERFDHPSLLAALLDEDKGGAWTVEPSSAIKGSIKGSRRYLEHSGVLETRLRMQGGECTITDWMPLGAAVPDGVCRLFSSAPQRIAIVLKPAPDYARGTADLQPHEEGVRIDGRYCLHASHPLVIEDGAIRFELPAGEEGWAVLANASMARPREADVRRWLNVTLDQWRDIASETAYAGPFETEVAQSLRALRLMTYAPNGGIIAAATTSLPEVPGGHRNYDYRYVWLRDTGMIMSALVRAGSQGGAARQFLEFICGSKQEDARKPLLPPFVSLDYQPAPDEVELPLGGYLGSRPVRIGNNANDQMQLDGFANVLLAAKLIYDRYGTREHWDTVRQLADFLAAHWRQEDNGIWEEHDLRQYTAGKVITSCALRYLAEHADNDAQARRWRDAAGEIHDHVAAHCLNAEGAYAAVAGGEAVDVSAALFPVWGYTAADAPEMLATMRVLERDHSDGRLYRRHLEEFDARKEGAFLAGTIWVAQYWVMRKDLPRARMLLETALKYANDLGFFAEEADAGSGRMLGNFPQTFVHAAFIGAVIDYRNALTGSGNGADARAAGNG
ncbi:glycoside hydrolase family 15 protein [Noviherbaspirillum cavernae]|uniref:Glycoside hydrolase family 15 protein n=1 Tax=Noviherbaspirillum cavernae TaxID=2320862 RepID=A0A418X4M3_9BURK|nr:glycoside hydrolase family 15 protein [Noviherbaspirillum cavernae]RJG07385.1 glycoside hydrolase family 15 protein [Noviherbaspirillum cavernae]